MIIATLLGFLVLSPTYNWHVEDAWLDITDISHQEAGYIPNPDVEPIPDLDGNALEVFDHLNSALTKFQTTSYYTRGVEYSFVFKVRYTGDPNNLPMNSTSSYVSIDEFGKLTGTIGNHATDAVSVTYDGYNNGFSSPQTLIGGFAYPPAGPGWSDSSGSLTYAYVAAVTPSVKILQDSIGYYVLVSDGSGFWHEHEWTRTGIPYGGNSTSERGTKFTVTHVNGEAVDPN